MGAERPPKILNDDAIRIIRFKARRLARRPGIEEEDMTQELILHVLEQAHHYDPARGSISTFVASVVDSCIAMILRGRQRIKRAAGLRAESVDAPASASDDEVCSRVERLTFGDLMRRTRSTPREPILDLDTTEALTRALEGMPDELQDFCQRLRTTTETEIARDLRISRRQVRNIKDRVRAHFERAGLGNL